MVKRNSGKAGECPVKADVPAGQEAEYAARIRRYIQKKSKLIRALMIATSAVFAALMLFIVIARAAELIQGRPAVFWAVAGVLGAAFVALAVAAGVNMYAFKKFLKRFE